MMDSWELDAIMHPVEAFISTGALADEVRELLAPYTIWFSNIDVRLGPIGGIEVHADVRADRPSAALALLESVCAQVADVKGVRLRPARQKAAPVFAESP